MAEEVKVKIVADADGAITSVEAAGDAFEELEDAQDEATASAERQADAQKEAANAAEQGADAQKDLATASEQSADAQNDTKQAAERAANAQREAASAAEKQADAQRQVSSTGGTANEILFSTGDAIQDAQFGFAGAANNIAFVAENFAQLSQKAGGAGGALKGIFGALSGPGGAIFALQTLLLVIPKIAEAFGGAEESSEDFTESLKNQSDVLQAIGGDLEGFSEDVLALENATDEFSTLGLGFLGGFDNALNTIISGRLGGSQLRSFVELLRDGSEQGENFRRVLSDAGVEVEGLATDNIPKLRDQVREQEEAFRDAASMLDELDAEEILGTSPSALAEAIEEQLNEFARSGATKVAFPQFFEGTEEELRQENLEQQIKLIDDALSAIVKKKPGISLTDDAFKGLNKRVKNLRKRLRALRQETEDAEQTEPLPGGDLEPAEQVDPAGLESVGDGDVINEGSKNIERLNRGLEQTSEEMINIGGMASDAMTQGITAAITAAVEGGNVLSAVGGVIGSFLQQVGKAIIAYGVAMESFKKALTNPFLAIAAGGALIAAGALVKSLVSSGPGGNGGGSDAGAQGADRPEGGGEGGVTVEGRAEGGPVSQGTPYMVGEEGPELFVPRASGKIVPNALGSASRRRGMRVQQQTDVSVDVTEPELFDLTARINESQRILDRVARQ